MNVSESIRELLRRNNAQPKRGGIIIMTPCMDARVDVLYVNSLIPTLQHSGAAHMFLSCDSNIAHARNTIANLFLILPEQFATLVMIDSDIAWSLDDWRYLMEGPEQIVIAEYARKSQDVPPPPPVRGGGGFCRVERAVLVKLQELTNDDGAERLPRYRENGQTYTDFFFTGATGDMRYLSEDRGLWTHCQLAGLIPRAETRTRLLHTGRAVYPYQPEPTQAA
jgi:hypothetical protein